MKVYFVEQGTTVVDSKGYTKMSDARKVQKTMRDSMAKASDKANVRVQTLTVEL